VSQFDSIIAIIVGLVMIVASFTTKQFYAATGILAGAPSNKKMPKWLGRLLILTIGSALLLFGIKFLVYGQ
jgi:hypothetical protein